MKTGKIPESIGFSKGGGYAKNKDHEEALKKLRKEKPSQFSEVNLFENE